MAKVICVLSGKGGVGKSTFTAYVGKALSENKKVLIIDGDVALRSLDIILGLESMALFDWSDVIFDRCAKEKACLFASENLHLLVSPPSVPQDFSNKDFEKLICSYKELYDYIIIDSPAGINCLIDIYTDVSDENIIIATPDDISIRAAYTAGDVLFGKGIPDSKMRLVINKADIRLMKKGLQRNLDDAVDKTYLRLLGVIPNDKTLSATGASGDFTVSDGTCEAFSDIAARISGKDVKLYI